MRRKIGATDRIVVGGKSSTVGEYLAAHPGPRRQVLRGLLGALKSGHAKIAWDESKHPRDGAGRFANKAGAAMDESARLARAEALGFDTREVLYHGGAVAFPHFRAGREGSSTHELHETPAIFLTNDPELANQYARSSAVGKRDKIVEIYGRNNKAAPNKYFEEAGAAENNKRYQAFLSQAADAIPDDVAGASMLKKMVRADTALDENSIREHLGDAAARVLELRAHAHNVGNFYAPGAQVYPVYVKRNLMAVDAGFFGGSFNEVAYDLLLKRAKADGFEGLRVRGVVDSPTGKGEPADVVAVFAASALRSKNAAFVAGAKSANLLG